MPSRSIEGRAIRKTCGRVSCTGRRCYRPSRMSPSAAAAKLEDPELAETAWDLEPLVDGEGEGGVESRLDDALARAKAFAERYAGRLGELDSGGLRDGDARAGRRSTSWSGAPAAYAALRFSTDTADPATGALLQLAQERGTAIETTLLFFELEWAALDDDRAEELLVGRRPRLLPPPPAQRAPLSRAPALRARGEDPRREGAHRRQRLDAAVRGADLGDRGRAAAARAMRPSRSTSRSAAWQLADREVRRTSAEAVTAALAPGLRTRAFLFNTLLADKAIDDRLRHYPHWLAARNLANEASDESVRALIEAVRGRYEIPRRWYRLKAQPARRRAARRLRPDGVGDRGRGQLPVRAGARDRARLLLVVLARARRASRSALLRRAPDRRAGAPGQARRRLLRLRRALGLPLRAAQLHLPPARRAHARPRARSRRPLRARRPAGHLPPEHAAHARGDGLGVRRDDRLRAAARARTPRPPRAWRCWPRTSRTRSRPSFARSR